MKLPKVATAGQCLAQESLFHDARLSSLFCDLDTEVIAAILEKPNFITTRKRFICTQKLACIDSKYFAIMNSALTATFIFSDGRNSSSGIHEASDSSKAKLSTLTEAVPNIVKFGREPKDWDKGDRCNVLLSVSKESNESLRLHLNDV